MSAAEPTAVSPVALFGIEDRFERLTELGDFVAELRLRAVGRCFGRHAHQCELLGDVQGHGAAFAVEEKLVSERHSVSGSAAGCEEAQSLGSVVVQRDALPVELERDGHLPDWYPPCGCALIGGGASRGSCRRERPSPRGGRSRRDALSSRLVGAWSETAPASYRPSLSGAIGATTRPTSVHRVESQKTGGIARVSRRHVPEVT